MLVSERSVAVCFSLTQLETIMAWDAARPRGFGVRVMTDHEDCPEMAEVYKHDKMSPLWFLNATQAGTMLMTKASGSEQELGTIEEALAHILDVEK
jgi:hypothetical protein